MKKIRLKNRHRYQRSVGYSEMKKLISSPKIVESCDDAGKDIKLEELILNYELKKESTTINKNGKVIRYSDEFKEAVVMEILSGLISRDGAKRKYGIGGKTTVQKWIQKHQNSAMIYTIHELEHRKEEKSIKEVEFQNLRLRKELELSKLKVHELNVMIDTAEIKTEVPIRKLFHQESLNYPCDHNNKIPVFSLNHFSMLAKRCTIKLMELVGM